MDKSFADIGRKALGDATCHMHTFDWCPERIRLELVNNSPQSKLASQASANNSKDFVQKPGDVEIYVDRAQSVLHYGQVEWSVISTRAGTEGVSPAIQALATVPGTSLKMTVTIRKNEDNSLSATHAIDFSFPPPNMDIQAIQSVSFPRDSGGLTKYLAGTAARAKPSLWIFGLLNTPRDATENMKLLRDSKWLNIRINANSQPLIVALEKGQIGEALFKAVFDLWQISPLK